MSISEATLRLLVTMKDEASAGLGNLTGALGALGTAGLAVAAAGVAALGAGIAAGVGDAQEARALYASTEQTIKTMGNAAGRSAQEVVDLASALSDAAGKSLFGDDQIQSAENLLLTFGNIRGATFDLATALTVDLAQALGGAPADQAMMLGKALNDPIKGITALGKAGLTFSEEQKAAIEAMVKTGDMAGAQALIIAELNKQVGGQAAAAAQAAGGWVQFKASLGETFETIGAQLLPVLDQLGAWLNSPEVQASIATFAANLGAGITVAAAWMTDTLLPALGQVWAYLQANVIPILSDVVTWLAVNLPPAIAAASEFVTGTLIPALQAAWAFLQENVVPILTEVAAWLIDNVPQAIAATADFVSGTLIPALTRAWMFLQKNVIPILAELVTWLLTNIPPAIASASEFVAGTLLPALAQLWSYIQANLLPIISTLVTWLRDNIPPAMRAVSEFITGTLVPAFSAVWKFIQVNVIPLLTALANVTIALVKKELELLAAIWTNVLQPALNTIWKFISEKVIPVFHSLADFVSDTLSGALSDLGDDLAPLKGWFSGIASAVEGVVKWLNDLAAAINSIEIPEWAQGKSPPPLAKWMTAIGEATQGASLALGSLSLPVGPSGGGLLAPAAAPAGAPGTTGALTFSAGAIVINQQPGQSQQALVEILMTEIERRMRAKK